MREIKFRLILDNQIVGYEVPEKMDIPMPNLQWRYFQVTGEEVGYLVHDNKEQYTGLKDKHGKEIYEGDIVKDEYRNRLVVEWTDNNSCIYYGRVPHQNFGYPIDRDSVEVEIIGNIHQNKELMEAQP